MYRRLMLALACLASLAVSLLGFTPSSALAGYPEGADQSWEARFNAWEDSSYVYPEPRFRGEDGSDAIVAGRIIRRDRDETDCRIRGILTEDSWQWLDGAELLWKVDFRSDFPSHVYLSAETTLGESFLGHPSIEATPQWTTFEFTMDPSEQVDLLQKFEFGFDTNWGEMPEYDVEFDNLQLSQDGGATWTVIESGGQPTPILGDTPIVPEARTTVLGPNYPNPFNPSTTIRYELAEAGQVTLNVFDVSGRVVAQLVGETQVAGTHAVHWDGTSTNSDVPLASGVYFYRIVTNGDVQTRSMMLVK